MNIHSNYLNQSFSGSFKYDKVETAKAISKLEQSDVKCLTSDVIDGINELKKRVEDSTPDTFQCKLEIEHKNKIRLYRDCFGHAIKRCADIVLTATCTSNPDVKHSFKDVVKLRYSQPRPLGMHSRMNIDSQSVTQKFDEFSTQIINFANSEGSDKEASVKFKPNSFASDIYEQLK